VVYFGFGVEGFTDDAAREELIGRIVDWFGTTTAAGDPALAAPLARLAQNVPNPFRPATSISYELGSAGPVQLRVYDVHGRVVRELVNGQQEAAPHTVLWNGTDDRGRAVASGIYFYRLETRGASEVRRMVLQR
jgi:flagellar hook assembly protein FlgD